MMYKGCSSSIVFLSKDSFLYILINGLLRATAFYYALQSELKLFYFILSNFSQKLLRVLKYGSLKWPRCNQGIKQTFGNDSIVSFIWYPPIFLYACGSVCASPVDIWLFPNMSEALYRISSNVGKVLPRDSTADLNACINILFSIALWVLKWYNQILLTPRHLQ